MLQGKRIAILIEEGFEDIELFEPLRAMKDAGAKVVIVGNVSQGCYKGKRATAEVKADTTADKVKAEDFDAIIMPGGYGPDTIRLHPEMIDLLKKASEMGKIIAAICHGTQLLISADIVKGRWVTSCLSVAVELQNAGAYWRDAPVVQDNNLITCRKTADIPKFNKAIIEAIMSKDRS